MRTVVHIARNPVDWWRNDTRRVIVASIMVLVLVVLGYFWLDSRQYFTVLEVLDGDTFVIDWNGRKQVQLAGSDAPEIHKQERHAIHAHEYLKSKIQGKRIRLVFLDPGDREDYKGRLLCWAWLDETNISYDLVARGLARFSGAAEGHERKVLVLLQKNAMNTGRGLWGSPSRIAGFSEEP